MHDAEHRFTRHDITYDCKAESGGVSLSGLARVSNARWVVEVAGTTRPLFEAWYNDLEPASLAEFEDRIVAAHRLAAASDAG